MVGCQISAVHYQLIRVFPVTKDGSHEPGNPPAAWTPLTAIGFHSGGQGVLKVMGKIKLRVLEETAMAGRGTSSHVHKSTGMNTHESHQSRQ